MSDLSGFPKISMPFVDEHGMITRPWMKFIEQLYLKVGTRGDTATSDNAGDSMQVSQNAAFMQQLDNLEAGVSQIYPLQSLVAAGGLTGPQGRQGFPGTPGYDGDDGEQGIPGFTGQTGATGLAGLSIPGWDGDEGEMGWPGPPGTSSSSGGGSYLIPTTMLSDLTIGASIPEQRLFRQHIIIGSFSIVLGTDSSMIGI